jgi:hypothetical protein
MDRLATDPLHTASVSTTESYRAKKQTEKEQDRKATGSSETNWYICYIARLCRLPAEPARPSITAGLFARGLIEQRQGSETERC